MSDNVQQQFDVFLSHSHIEAAIVQQLGELLTDEAHFRVWLDKWVLIPGQRWRQEVEKGLQEAKSCAVCIGQQPPEGWFLEEIELALRRHTHDKSFRVIPVILPKGDETHLVGFLAGRTSVNFSLGLDDRDARHRLACGIKGIPPGRGLALDVDSAPEMLHLKENLTRIKQLRSERLIDDVVALDFQRRLVDEFIAKNTNANET